MLKTVVIFIVGQVVPLQVDDIYVYSSLTLVAFFQLFPFHLMIIKCVNWKREYHHHPRFQIRLLLAACLFVPLRLRQWKVDFNGLSACLRSSCSVWRQTTCEQWSPFVTTVFLMALRELRSPGKGRLVFAPRFSRHEWYVSCLAGIYYIVFIIPF